MKHFLARTAFALILAGGALLLTGCQSPGTDFDRALDVTPAQETAAPTPTPEAAKPSTPSAGLDLHFGPASFGISCATDSAGDSTSGTAALMCSWKTGR